MGRKVAIVSTHPIQYYAPLFKMLAQEIELKVFYTWGNNLLEKYDPGFGKKVQWDVPLLEGYDFEYLENTAKQPGSHHFNGIKNPTIIKDIEYFNPSLILIIGWGYDSHLKVIRHFKGKVLLYFRGDSTLLDNNQSGLVGSIKNLARRFFLIWVYSHVDKFFYVGTESKLYFRWALVKDTQLIFSPHSIDNDRFCINHKERTNELRISLGIPIYERVILFAGKFESKKNPLLILNAFLDSTVKDLHLLFLGNGVEEYKLKELAKASDKKSFIHFVDFQNQSVMPIWYQMADVFCLPSQGPGETWGLAVNEAMACSKAIIVSEKVGSAKDLVKNGINGWIFKNNSKKELLYILNNLPPKEILREMGNKSKEIVENWSLDIVSQNMLKEFIYN